MLNYLISLIIATYMITPISGVVLGATDVWSGLPERKITTSFEPVIAAKGALAMDTKSGKILFQKNGFEPRPIASISKLMTALVFLERKPDLQKTAAIGRDDKENGGTYVFAVGEDVALKDVFYTALVGSVNSAAEAMSVATDLSQEEFIRRMNDKAREIGMEGTTFVEPTGLSDKNIATPMDVAKLIKAALDEPMIREVLSKKNYSFKTAAGVTHNVKNTNLLLGSYLNISGGKTGFTDAAGYCLANLVKCDHCGHGIIVVILGASSAEERFQENKFLSQWVMDNWEW